MRTLSRPMFNMGGPIKQGVMHGIREPYKHGGQAAPGLVGHPAYPRTGSREHHAAFVLPALWAAGRFLARPFAKQVIKKVATSPKGPWTGGIFGGKTGQTIAQKTWEPTKFGKWFQKDPLYKAGATGTSWAGKGLQKAGRGIKWAGTTPSGLATTGLPVGWFGGKALYNKLTGEKVTDPVTGTGGVPGGGDPGMTYTSPENEIKVLSDAERKAFANKQRSERVQKYLDMMGYDRAKKTAIADALIDASKIVSDRGTLDKKNITAELINPAIQAFSRRLDKPAQIREAVGLMATKAEIEKDLNKETKDLDRRYKKAQIKAAEAGLEATESFEGGLQAFISARKGTVDPITLERISRLLANEHNEPFTKVTEETDVSGLEDGIYMSGSKIIRMTGGVSQQIV